MGMPGANKFQKDQSIPSVVVLVVQKQRTRGARFN